MKVFLSWLKNVILSRRFSLVLLSLVTIVVIVQLVYPSDRTLPFASVAGASFGGKTKPELEARINDLYHESRITFRVGAVEKEKLSFDNLGATPNTTVMAAKALEYPLWQRFLPLSILFTKPNYEEVIVDFDSDKLEQVAASEAAILHVEPINATIAIENEKPTIKQETAGAKVESAALRQSIVAADYRLGAINIVDVIHEATPASRRSEDVQSLAVQAEKALDGDFSIAYSGQFVAVDRKTRSDWLEFTDGQNGELVVGYNVEKIGEYLNANIAAKVAVAAGTIKVKTVDSVEVSRTPGGAGKALDIAKSSEEIGKALVADAPLATVVIANVAPRVIYDRSYSSTHAGLNSYLNDLANDANIKASVHQIGGNNWGGEAKGSVADVAASTYKLYTAVYTLDQIDQGKIAMSSPVNGTSVGSCLEKMIVVSDNACAEALRDKFGAKNINQFLYDRGYSRSTTFIDASAVKTTTNDLMKVLIDIQTASIIQPNSRDYLLGLMKRQVYRKGVPAGAGATVANKVGFLWDYLNDAAIVYHPRGTYAIAIITKGQSWAKIAEITRQVEKIMYP